VVGQVPVDGEASGLVNDLDCETPRLLGFAELVNIHAIRSLHTERQNHLSVDWALAPRLGSAHSLSLEIVEL
jgi:hypothetical protein